MATRNSEDHAKNILVLSANLIPKNNLGHSIKTFTTLTVLARYVCDHVKDTDNFHLHVFAPYLEELLENLVQGINQVRRIYVYYDTKNALQSVQNRVQFVEEKLKLKFNFYHQRDFRKQLEKAESGRAVSPSRYIDRTTIHNIAQSKMERLSRKRTNTSDRHSTVQDDHFMNNINLPFICSSCQLFFQEPYQLECGHRQCKACVDSQKTCGICSESILKDKAWFDRGFQNEIQHLLTTCLECEWTGPFELYQDHRNQNHQDITISSISNEQVAQSTLHQQISSALYLIHPANKSNDHNAMFTLRNSTTVVHHNIQLQQWSPFQTTDVLAERYEIPLNVGAGALPNDERHADTIDDDIFKNICHSDTVQ